MKTLYETQHNDKRVVLYRALLRSAIQKRWGYAIGIDEGDGIKTYPVFPKTFSSINEVQEFLGRYDNNGKKLADALIFEIKSRARQERQSKLYRGHAFPLFESDLKGAEELLEQASKFGDKLAAMEKLAREAEKLVGEYDILLNERTEEYSEMMRLLDEENKKANEENQSLSKQARQLEHTLSICKPLLDLGEEKALAYLSLMKPVIPETTDISPNEKYRMPSKPHHRANGMDAFVDQLCKIPYITKIVYEREAGNNSHPVKINPKGDILVIYYADHPQELIVKTTAKNPIQQEFVAAYIREKFFGK